MTTMALTPYWRRFFRVLTVLLICAVFIGVWCDYWFARPVFTWVQKVAEVWVKILLIIIASAYVLALAKDGE